jgi:hypothetical protein
MEKLNVSCLKTDKAKRLKELNSMSIGLDSGVDNVIFKEQIKLAKELVSELQKDNQKFIFALKNWDDNQVSFICKPATFTSLDGEFGINFEYQALDIDVNGYFEFEYFEEMIKDFKNDTRFN